MYNYLEELKKNKDDTYREFNARILATVPIENVIGVKVPIQREIAREFYKQDKDGAIKFLNSLPHNYFEENQIHGFIIQNLKDYDEVLKRLEEFLPYIDNWATCDTISPKVFKKCPPEISLIEKWIATEKTYIVRFAVDQLMNYYTKDLFKKEYLDIVKNIKSNEYYVNMMRAWFFQTALQNKYDVAIKYIENNELDLWTHNKAIQKSIESFRIPDERKEYLRTLRRKNEK